ncbi:MAG: LamG domain-containing protein [Candidatus Poribacteria bacterium]|nr:LamG domain-containing protein [Candidatus Poribacteria bacterium]
MKMLLFFLMFTLTLTMFIHNGYTEPIVTDGLVSYWTFDKQDIAGGTVKDVWGENDGKIVGDPKVVDGQVGEALEFDGSDDYVNLTNLGDFGEKVGASTFEAWVKTSFKKDWTTLFKVLDQGCNMAWAIDVNRSAKAGFPLAEDIVHYYVRQKSAAGCNAIVVEIEFALSDGKWHHIVFGIVDPGKSDVSIYMDGEPQEIIVGDAKKLDTFIPFVEPVYIGAANNRGNVERHFPGIIDEVRIYDRPLTADEVTRNFKSKIGLSVQAAEKLPIVWGNLKTEL